MQRVVLPSETSYRLAIVIEHGETISVELDPVMNPIPMVPPAERRDDRHNGVPAAEETWKRSGRIGGIWPRPIHVGRLVGWNVDTLWVEGLDHDRLPLPLGRHGLLRR